MSDREKRKCGNVELWNFVTSAVNTGEMRDSSIKRGLGCVVTPKVSFVGPLAYGVTQMLINAHKCLINIYD